MGNQKGQSSYVVNSTPCLNLKYKEHKWSEDIIALERMCIRCFQPMLVPRDFDETKMQQARDALMKKARDVLKPTDE